LAGGVGARDKPRAERAKRAFRSQAIAKNGRQSPPNP
jgi:hypothetical protein